MLINQSVVSYLNVLASDAYAPGGGSAAALVGATGVSLMQMSIRLTSSAQQTDRDLLQDALVKLEDKRQELIKMVDEDAIAFSGLMKAYQMPRVDSKEAEVRMTAIQTAVVGTTTVPLKAAKVNLEALILGETLYESINPNLISDLKIGLMHCFIGVQGSIINVEVNLPLLKDRELKRKLTLETDQVKNHAQAIYDKINSKLKVEG